MTKYLSSFITGLKGLLTTKGDILSFSTTESRLGVGANDTVLTADSTESLGLKWAAISGGMTVATEANTTPVSDNIQDDATNARDYAFFTLPTSSKFFKISGIEWKNGTSVGGDMISGVDIVDADPPTVDGTKTVAFGFPVANSGTNAVQRNSNINSDFIPKGTICGAWIKASSVSRIRLQNGLTSQNQMKTMSYSANPTFGDSTSWSAQTKRAYIKVYYVGYS